MGAFVIIGAKRAENKEKGEKQGKREKEKSKSDYPVTRKWGSGSQETQIIFSFTIFCRVNR